MKGARKQRARAADAEGYRYPEKNTKMRLPAGGSLLRTKSILSVRQRFNGSEKRHFASSLLVAPKRGFSKEGDKYAEVGYAYHVVDLKGL